MEEENDNIKKRPNLPPNYVTLLQLQERWVKEKQRKQKGKEEEEEEAEASKQNEEPNRKPETAQPIERISRPRYHRRNRILKLVGAGDHRKETNGTVSASVIVEGNGSESGVNKEVRSEGLRKKKKKNKNGWKNKKKREEKDGEEDKAQNEKVEEEEAVRDAHAPPVIPVRINERRSETYVEYRPKINDVEEIEGNFGDLSIGNATEKLSLRGQNRVINHGSRAYRGYNSGVYGCYRHYGHRGGYVTGAKRGNGYSKGGNWKLNHGNWQGSGAYRRFNGYRGRNVEHGEMVWVKKGEVADGGDIGDVVEN